MKIIDEKGRLFAKINIIDFLAVVFLLSLTPMFYFGYKLCNNKAPEVKVQEQQQKPKKEFIKIMINCKFIRLKPEASKMISVGDKEWDSDGNLMGEIVSLGEFLPYIYKFDVGPNQELIRKDPELRQIAVTLKINAAVRGKNIYYKDKQISEGGPLEFSAGRYSAEAEGIAIIKDNYNTVIVSTAVNVSVKEEKLDTIKKEFESQLSTLEIRLDSLLEQMTSKTSELQNKTSELQNKTSELENEINLSKPDKKKDKR